MNETETARNIIITEKADAARRIAYILSEGTSKQKRTKGLNFIEYGEKSEHTYVIPLSGHIIEIDFPSEFKDWKGSDLQELTFSKIIKRVKNRSAFNSLVSLSGFSERIIVATDFDREGELIGVEALDIIRENVHNKTRKKPEILRARFSSLTGEDVRNAFSTPSGIDVNLADSASAREEIDLIWGAALTRFFSLASKRLGKNFLSVGRVQTPTLAIVVRRENEIQEFKPVPYWKINITFNKGKDFVAGYKEDQIWDKGKADEIFSSVNGKDGKVKSFERKEEPIPKPIPFNTTEFLREASRIGIHPAKAMKIAESLYTRGYISYPRTDNTVYQRSIYLKGVLEKLLSTQFKADVEKVISQETIRPSRGRTETTDHPPIYPVSAAKDGTLKGDFLKVYELVVRRFLATLYRPGRREIATALIDVNGNDFIAPGLRVLDPGWLELYPYRNVNEVNIPEMKERDSLKGRKWDLLTEETKPPRRFDLASLIKRMEELKLGTKSTRHDIIGKLQERGYIEGNPVRPTELGKGLIDALLKVKSGITEPDMTAKLEEDMDEIAASRMQKDQVVRISREMLSSVLIEFKDRETEIGETIQSALKRGTAVGKCPEHGTDILMIRYRDSGRLKCATEGCRIDFPIKLVGLPQIMDTRCEKCGLPMVKIIRRGQSPETRCIDPKCEYNQSRDTIGTCPKDGGNLIVRQSRFGKRFIGCANYPECNQTYPLPQMGYLRSTGDKCPECGSPILSATRGKGVWKFCPKMDCGFNHRKVKKNESKNKHAS